MSGFESGYAYFNHNAVNQKGTLVTLPKAAPALVPNAISVVATNEGDKVQYQLRSVQHDARARITVFFDDDAGLWMVIFKNFTDASTTYRVPILENIPLALQLSSLAETCGSAYEQALWGFVMGFMELNGHAARWSTR